MGNFHIIMLMRKVFNIRQQRKINFDFQRCVLFGCIVFIIFIDNPVSVYFLACVFPVSRLISRRVRLWFGIGYNIQRSVRLNAVAIDTRPYFHIRNHGIFFIKYPVCLAIAHMIRL